MRGLTCVRLLLVPDACMHVCFSVSSGSFEQGSFCETFHSDVAGWRNCEACGKVCVRVHAVSLASFVPVIMICDC